MRSAPMSRTLFLTLGFLALLIPRAAEAQNTISTVAGGGVSNNVSAVSAGIEGPTGVAQDTLGNSYSELFGNFRSLYIDAGMLFKDHMCVWELGSF
jgi:hypothetical protein